MGEITTVDLYKGKSKRTRVYRGCDHCHKSYWGFKGSRFCDNSCSTKAIPRIKHSAGITKQEYKKYHQRLARKRGKANYCTFGCTAPKYEWANITGHYHLLMDYESMCIPCHRWFDRWQEKAMG